MRLKKRPPFSNNESETKKKCKKMNNNEGTMKGKVDRELKTLSFTLSFHILFFFTSHYLKPYITPVKPNQTFIWSNTKKGKKL